MTTEVKFVPKGSRYQPVIVSNIFCNLKIGPRRVAQHQGYLLNNLSTMPKDSRYKLMSLSKDEVILPKTCCNHLRSPSNITNVNKSLPETLSVSKKIMLKGCSYHPGICTKDFKAVSKRCTTIQGTPLNEIKDDKFKDLSYKAETLKDDLILKPVFVPCTRTSNGRWTDHGVASVEIIKREALLDTPMKVTDFFTQYPSTSISLNFETQGPPSYLDIESKEPHNSYELLEPVDSMELFTNQFSRTVNSYNYQQRPAIYHHNGTVNELVTYENMTNSRNECMRTNKSLKSFDLEQNAPPPSYEQLFPPAK